MYLYGKTLISLHFLLVCQGSFDFHHHCVFAYSCICFHAVLFDHSVFYSLSPLSVPHYNYSQFYFTSPNYLTNLFLFPPSTLFLPSLSSPPILFQMFDDWFSGSEPNGSGLSSELTSDLGSDLGSVFSESSFVSGSGLDFKSAWSSGEVYCCGLLSEPANKKAEIQSKASVLRWQQDKM